MRFRAPSVFNSQTSDGYAPAYFAKNVVKGKSIPISVAAYTDPGNEIDAQEKGIRVKDKNLIHSLPQLHAVSYCESAVRSVKYSPVGGPYPNCLKNTDTISPQLEQIDTSNSDHKISRQHSSGDLRSLAPAIRAKQPSAYSSLCDWVSHLSIEVGYVVEREMLRIPSTRNVGIIGRAWHPDTTKGEYSSSISVKSDTDVSLGSPEKRPSTESIAKENALGGRQRFIIKKRQSKERPEAAKFTAARRERVIQIAKMEGANGKVWIQRCVGLGAEKSAAHA